MKRSPLQRKTPMRRASPKREATLSRELAGALTALLERPAAPRRAVMALVQPTTARPVPKVPDRVNQAIRDSARGEDCTVRIPGACTHDPEKTIWSHAPLGAAGKGRSIKALDLCGAYCCTACDAVIDGQAPLPPGYTRAMAMLDWFMGHMRSLVRLRQRGLA